MTDTQPWPCDSQGFLPNTQEPWVPVLRQRVRVVAMWHASVCHECNVGTESTVFELLGKMDEGRMLRVRFQHTPMIFLCRVVPAEMPRPSAEAAPEVKTELVAKCGQFVVTQVMERDTLALMGPGINCVIRAQHLPQLGQFAIDSIAAALQLVYHEGQRKKMRDIKAALEIDPCRFRG